MLLQDDSCGGFWKRMQLVRGLVSVCYRSLCAFQRCSKIPSSCFWYEGSSCLSLPVPDNTCRDWSFVFSLIRYRATENPPTGHRLTALEQEQYIGLGSWQYHPEVYLRHVRPELYLENGTIIAAFWRSLQSSIRQFGGAEQLCQLFK